MCNRYEKPLNETNWFDFIERKFYTAVTSNRLMIWVSESVIREDVCPLYIKAVIVGKAMPILSIDV